MSILRLVLLALLVVAAGCAHREALPSAFVSAPSQEQYARAQRLLSVAPALDRYLADEMSKRRFPSLSFGLVAGGRLIWSRGLGVRDPAVGDSVTADTVFRMGSITKVFTGTAILALRDAGKLSLDAPASTYLPELGDVVYPTRDSAPITIRHLVTHTSGLPRVGPLHYDDGHELGRDEITNALKGLKLEFSPGEKASYSNLAMACAGLIVEHVSGERYRDFVARHVLTPLGMTESSFDLGAIPRERLAAGFVKKHDGYHPGGAHWRLGAGEAMGGLYSSVTDMAKFMAFELAAWPPRDDPESGPLRRSSVREAQSIAGFAAAGRQGFGVNFVVMADAKLGRVAFHNGATEAFSASMWLLPAKGVGVVAMAGSTDSPGLDEMTRGALVLIEAAGLEPEPTLGEAAAQALRRVRALLDHADAQAIENAFTSDFLKEVSVDQVMVLVARIAGDVGRCTTERVEKAPAPNRASVHIGCEHGGIDIDLTAEKEPPFLIEGITYSPTP